MSGEPDISYLLHLARDLQKVKREGAAHDEPEGARYITLSDTLAKQIADNLVMLYDRLKGQAESA